MIKRRNISIKYIALLSFASFAWFLSGCLTPASNVTLPASAEAIAAGNIENGQALFMGYAHFENDGPPCMGCHSVGENGLLGGGAMGPNLTNITTERNQDDLVSILSNSGSHISPVMQPIYADFPLTEREQADLIAFLNSSVGQPEMDREWHVIGISLAGFAASVLVLGFVYRGRLRGVRRALVEKAISENS